MTFARFKERAAVSQGDFCLEMFNGHRRAIKAKKEAVAVKNLGLILQATLELGNRKGFRAMTMRDLSRASGLSMGALYDYFASKDQLLEMIQAAGRRITGRIMHSSVQAGRSAADNLAEAIRSHVYLSEVMQEWFFFSYMEARHLGEREKNKAMASELYTERLFAGIIRQGNRQGVFAAARPNLAAALIKAMVQDWYLKRWKYVKRRVSVDRYAGQVVEAALHICRPADATVAGKGRGRRS